jgi:hypothetical protein
MFRSGQYVELTPDREEELVASQAGGALRRRIGQVGRYGSPDRSGQHRTRLCPAAIRPKVSGHFPGISATFREFRRFDALAFQRRILGRMGRKRSSQQPLPQDCCLMVHEQAASTLPNPQRLTP